MTPAEIAALSDRELDAFIAEHLFGWTWLEHKSAHDAVWRKGLFPPEGSEYERVNYAPGRFQPARPGIERFSDWDRCGYRAGSRPLNFMPHYSTDPAAMMEVLEVLRKTHFVYIKCTPVIECRVVLEVPAPGKCEIQVYGKLPRAVAEAAALAKGA